MPGKVRRFPQGLYSTELLPRPLPDPTYVQIGDLISASFPADRGITSSKRGRVMVIRDQGRVRRFETEDGAVIFAWQIGGVSNVQLTLIERAEFENAVLPGM